MQRGVRPKVLPLRRLLIVPCRGAGGASSLERSYVLGGSALRSAGICAVSNCL